MSTKSLLALASLVNFGGTDKMGHTKDKIEKRRVEGLEPNRFIGRPKKEKKKKEVEKREKIKGAQRREKENERKGKK